MMLGRVDDVDGDYIATEFIAGVVPTSSMYVAQMNARTTQSGADGRTRIRQDWRSIALGYARLWFPVVAIGVPLLQALRGHILAATWVTSVALLGVAIASYATARLPEADKARYRVLGTVTGMRLDPSRLYPGTRDVKRDLLGQLMTRAGIPTTPDGILSVLDDIPVPAMPLVFGYACYAGDTPDWRECAALVYARYEVADK